MYLMNLAEVAHLTTLYSSNQRAYHNLSHIMNLLWRFEKNSDAICKYLDIDHDEAARGHNLDWYAKALITSIWWHDAVYIVGSKFNEQSSANLFRSWYIENGKGMMPVDNHFLQLVTKMIMATKDHMVTQDEARDGKTITARVTAVMLDLDLAGLADRSSKYWESTMGIYVEAKNAGFSVQEFLTGREKFLSVMIRDRDPLYYTPIFAPLTEQARFNMEEELDEVQKALASRDPVEQWTETLSKGFEN